MERRISNGDLPHIVMVFVLFRVLPDRGIWVTAGGEVPGHLSACVAALVPELPSPGSWTPQVPNEQGCGLLFYHSGLVLFVCSQARIPLLVAALQLNASCFLFFF